MRNESESLFEAVMLAHRRYAMTLDRLELLLASCSNSIERHGVTEIRTFRKS
jgi:hypothetical protein